MMMIRLACAALTVLSLMKPAHAATADHARHASGVVLMLANQRMVKGTLTSAEVKVGNEAGLIIFDDQLSGVLISAQCTISIKAHGQKYNDGWTVRATIKESRRPCFGVPDGVYLTF